MNHKSNCMATKLSYLPLFIIHQNEIYKNHILSIDNLDITIIPFEHECEATKFISNTIIITTQDFANHIPHLPTIDHTYKNLRILTDYLLENNLYHKNDKEPTLVSAGPSGYNIL